MESAQKTRIAPRRLTRLAVHLIALPFLLMLVQAPAVALTSSGYVSAQPGEIAFGNKHVGRTYYKKSRITNLSDQPMRVLVYAGLPDDFGFGLLPGSTCPVLDGGSVIEPGGSCVAVVRFTPSDGFIGWHAVGEMWVDSYDPSTGALLDHFLIPVTGTARG